MIYIVTACYPGNKVKKVLEALKKAPKIPSYIKKWQVFGTADGYDGYKAYNLIFVEEKASDEAVIFIAKMQHYYVENVEGYKWKIETVLSMKDTMKVIS